MLLSSRLVFSIECCRNAVSAAQRLCVWLLHWHHSTLHISFYVTLCSVPFSYRIYVSRSLVINIMTASLCVVAA